MAKLIYSVNPSLDSFITGLDGNFDWSTIPLKLQETRTFAGRVVYLRYERA